MGRRVAPAVAISLVMLLTGCGLPEGIDGDLAGGWAEMPEAVVFAPEAGTCHNRFSHTGSRSDYDPVPCEQRHRAETVHVGTFTGEAADRTSVPPRGSPERVAAYQECDAAAAEFLGDDFRHGRLWLGLIVPTRSAWDGGARWFRCDLEVWQSVDDYSPALRAGSLAGALAGDDHDIALGCANPENDEDDDTLVAAMNPVRCDRPHTTEFAGVWTVPDTRRPDFDVEDDRLRAHRECAAVIAEHIGVSDTAVFRSTIGSIVFPITEEDWQAGDRGMRCYLRTQQERTASLAGAGEDWQTAG